MVCDKGGYSFESAVPLDSGDGDDVRTEPGESFHFNIA
jgi:hypothetical protein